jgi:putative Mg2+ transporter-C (MgtC) family protein
VGNFFYAISLALVLGSLIGVERQWHRRLVDLKTNALVSLAACLFMLATKNPDGYTDPVRMAGQIVVGVGFIGGGLLFREGALTKGVNTAATLWCSAAVGTLCGLDRGLEGSIAAVFIVVANTVLRNVAQFLNMKMGVTDSLTEVVRFDFECDPPHAADVRRSAEKLFRDRGVDVRAIGQKSNSEQICTLSITVLFEHAEFAKQINEIMDQMDALKINNVSWTHV